MSKASKNESNASAEAGNIVEAGNKNDAVSKELLAVDAEVAAVPTNEAQRPQDEAAFGQVRDLLFGTVVEELRNEFRKNARSVLGTVKSLHREFTLRTDELQKQIDEVSGATDIEAEQREQQGEALTELLNEATDAMSAKLKNSEREIERSLSRVGADLQTQDRNQKRELEELESKLMKALEEHSSELRNGKLNRDEFASLLSSLAGKVSGDAANEEEQEQPAQASAG